MKPEDPSKSDSSNGSSNTMAEESNSSQNDNGKQQEQEQEQQPQPHEESAAAGSSGYSAEATTPSSVSSPPDYIALTNSLSKVCSETTSKHAKGNKNYKAGANGEPITSSNSHEARQKQKALEFSFTASKVWEDIAKGGLEAPKINTANKKRRIGLDGVKIDMSNVNLAMAKTVQESPFLVQRDVPIKMPDTTEEYSSLFTASYPNYNKVSSSQGWDCSTAASSVTSSESEDVTNGKNNSNSINMSMPPPRALVIPPRLEDAIKANEAFRASEAEAAAHAAATKGKRKRPLVDATKLLKLQYMTLNDAFEACKDARYVLFLRFKTERERSVCVCMICLADFRSRTHNGSLHPLPLLLYLFAYRVVALAFAPFIVVHVNTSYTRLTGFSSDKVLGKPLRECLGEECKRWVQSAASQHARHPVTALHDQITCIRSNQDSASLTSTTEDDTDDHKKKKTQSCSCKISTCLVGPQLQVAAGAGSGKTTEKDECLVDKSSVTHYVIGFVPVDAAEAATAHKGEAAEKEKDAAAAHLLDGAQVMG